MDRIVNRVEESEELSVFLSKLSLGDSGWRVLADDVVIVLFYDFFEFVEEGLHVLICSLYFKLDICLSLGFCLVSFLGAQTFLVGATTLARLLRSAHCLQS